MSTPDQTTNFKLVVLKDDPREWKPEILEEAGGVIYSTYLVDTHAPVNCAELTPSFYFRHLFSTPKEDDGNGSIHEKVREGYLQCDNDKHIHCASALKWLDSSTVYDFGVEIRLLDEEDRRAKEDEYAEYAEANRGRFELPRTSKPHQSPEDAPAAPPTPDTGTQKPGRPRP